MSKSVKFVYEFHFKMDIEMKKKLESSSIYKKAGCMSRTIVRILTILSPQIEKIHFTDKPKKSRYRYINDDKTIVRESVHVFLPESLYLQLKMMHHSLNYYSIAQLLRAILRFYLYMVEVYSESILSGLQAFFRYWKKKVVMGKYRWKPIRQLLFFIYQKPRISRYLMLYSRKFSPIGAFRL